jgi:HEAT repeat protein
MNTGMLKKFLLSISLCLLSQLGGAAEELKSGDRIIEQLLSEDAQVRQEGKNALLSIARKHLSDLKKYLNYKDEWRVRYDAVSALSAIPSRESTKLLLGVIFHDTHPSVISAAGYGLKGREKTVTQDELLRLLEIENPAVLEAALGIVQKRTINEAILASLARRLEDKRWYIRRDVARALSKVQGITTETKVRLTLNVMKTECENPTPEEGTKGEGMCIPLTEHLKSLYRSAVLEIGSSTIPFLEDRAKKEKGEFRKNLVITLGLLGEQEIYADLLQIAAADENPWLRTWAIDGLGKVGNKRAIPLLKEALEDSFHVDSCSDVQAPPGFEEWNVSYPIRNAAFSALTKLGVKVESKGKGIYKIVE